MTDRYTRDDGFPPIVRAALQGFDFDPDDVEVVSFVLNRHRLVMEMNVRLKDDPEWKIIDIDLDDHTNGA